jgi:hypothetical protein
MDLQKDLIETTLQHVLSSVRSTMINKKADTGTLEVSEKFKLLQGKYGNRAIELSEKFEELKVKCKLENLNPDDFEEMTVCKKEYEDCLKELNAECLLELGGCTAEFLDAISMANGTFAHQLIELATVFGDEGNVDFGSIIEMYKAMHVHTRATANPYKSCHQIRQEFIHDDAGFNVEIMRHRKAAFIYSGVFEEDPSSAGYKVICPALFNVNEANRKSASRTKDYLINFTIGMFKAPWTWHLVRFLRDGTKPPDFIQTDGAQNEFSKQAITDAMKEKITTLASKF